MVYFLGDWGMGDSDCTSYQHVPQIPSAHINQFHHNHHQPQPHQHQNQQNDDILSLTQELNNQTSISNVSSISSSAVTVNLQQLSVSDNRLQLQPPPRSPLYIGRQRSESCAANVGAGTSVNNNNHHHQKDFNLESDDEVSLHPLSNQVSNICSPSFISCSFWNII